MIKTRGMIITLKKWLSAAEAVEQQLSGIVSAVCMSDKV